MAVPVLRFPDGFVWGSATASYQIEGSPLADGAGASIWHTFSHTPGVIAGDDNGDVACDHYRRWKEDVALMRDLGLKAYRFSVAWPRVLPDGDGAVNEAGLAFYDRLTDELLAAGIEPMVTLYHWDLPQALEDRGGWANPQIGGIYASYAETMFSRLGDRVKKWITFNEPWVFHWVGSVLGIHAPGKNDMASAILGGHHTLRAHGLAVRRFRDLVPGGEIGITVSVQAHRPATDDPEDVAAAARARAFQNEWFVDPIVLGDYPAALREQFSTMLPEIGSEDRALFGERIDFVGVNYYTRNVHRHDENGFFRAAVERPAGVYTAMDWEIYPAGLLEVLREFHARYGLPIYVTENGAGFEDERIAADGVVHDGERLRYVQSHLEMCHRAIAEGVDLRGYLVWSLMDNFEWGFGYAKRFGIVRCDFATQARTAKQSALWFRDVIAANGV
jgi:beta-glucosidase